MFESPDPELDTALELAKSDPDQAAQVLRIAARYLHKHEKLPSALASYLAVAFEQSMKMASVVRGDQLLINLNLKAMNRRVSANFEHVGIEFERLVATGISKGEAILQLCETYEVTESTIKRMVKKYSAYKNFEMDSDAVDLMEEQRYFVRQPIGTKNKK